MGKLRKILRGLALRPKARQINAAKPRFEQYVETAPDDDCWTWTGGTDKDGYPLFWFCGRSHPAQRVAYVLYREPIPAGVDGHHTCENRNCVNPWHVELKPRDEHVFLHHEKRRAAGVTGVAADAEDGDIPF